MVKTKQIPFNNNTIVRNILILSLLFLLLRTSFTQIPELRVKYYSSQDGLISSFFNQVAQDSLGIIWGATNDGLYKFDGFRFYGYQSIQNDTLTLVSNNVNCLYASKSGKFWIGTNLGLCTYDYDYNNFHRICDIYNNFGLTNTNIIQLLEDISGNLIVVSNTEISRYLESKNKFEPLFSINEGNINQAKIDHNNNLWIATSKKGLIKYDLISGKSKPYHVFGEDDSNKYAVSSIDIDNNDIWIATLGDGIKTMNLNTGKVVNHPSNNIDETMAVYVYIDNEQQIWSVDYTGLKNFSKQYNSFIGCYPNPNNPFSVRAGISKIFQDKQNNYWLVHNTGGLGLSMRLKGFHNFIDDSYNYWKLSSSNILSILVDDKGNFWFGNAANGIDVFDWTNGPKTYKNDPDDQNSLGRGAIQCMFRDSKNNIWIGSYFDGLQLFNKNKNNFITYRHNPEDSNSIACNDVRSITEDRDGYLWIVVHGKGIDRFDPKNKKFEHFNTEKNKLSNDWTNKVITDHNNNIWVATAWGINVLDKDRTHFKSFFSTINDTNSLTNNEINSVFEDNEHNIWVGTSAGLNLLMPGKNQFIRFEKGFENNHIASVACDSKNNIWVSTLSGLSKLDYRTNKIHNFNESDGLWAGEYNDNACFINHDSLIFFGGIMGVDFFKPTELVYNETPPTVILDKLKILNKPVVPSPDNKILRKQLHRTNEITLEPKHYVFSISFKALNYINPEQNEFAYKLDGFEEQWNYVGNATEATYTNLNPGKYTFRVKAANNDGFWNEEGASLKIKVLPPWYKTFIFKTTITILIVILIISFVRYRTRRLTKQKKLLERAVNEKTNELIEKNELLRLNSENLREVNDLLIERQQQLEQQSEELLNQADNLSYANEELKKTNHTKDRLFSIIAHDLSSPFNTILGFSELLMMRYGTLEDEEKQEYIKIINTSSDKLYSLLQNLLLWAGSQTKKISYFPEDLEVISIINENIELRSENLKNKNISIKIDCPEHISIWADADMFKTIIRNVLSNAIKFTSANGTITFYSSEEKDYITIIVKDTGIGMNNSTIKEILSSEIINPGTGTAGERGSGLGLTLCRDFILMNNGKMDIQSEEGKGTSVILSLPKSGWLEARKK
ncbi:MAG: hypothetical protein JXA77_14405 [Bacteroidales bacterium]|nr:hypothetical protein [Bacteroidales bacterium]MBN2821191.1 hypothetical protein [Bacteroidales bacterium]